MSSVHIDHNPNSDTNLTFSRIVANLSNCTFQTVIGYVCLDIIFAISLHFVSTFLGSYASAGLGLSYTVVNVLVIPMALGINQSLNVHVSQSIGANKEKLSKSYITISFYFHICYLIPLACILYCLKTPFAYTIPAEERQETSDFAWTYLVYLMASTLFAIEFEALKAFLLAHKITSPFMVIQLFTTCLHYFWCYLLVEKYSFGIHGAGAAIIITEVLNIILLSIWVSFTNLRIYFKKVSLKIIWKQDKDLIKSYIKSSFAIVIHIYLEFVVFFFMNFVCLNFGNKSMNAQMALSNTSGIFYSMFEDNKDFQLV